MATSSRRHGVKPVWGFVGGIILLYLAYTAARSITKRDTDPEEPMGDISTEEEEKQEEEEEDVEPKLENKNKLVFPKVILFGDSITQVRKETT